MSLDVSRVSSVVDQLIICGADSEPQLQAIATAIGGKLRLAGHKGFRWEGPPSSGWLVLDLGSVVVHVMRDTERKYYDLEGLWGKEAVVYHY